MRKVLKNHDEVAHFWANKVQNGGKASNMFFEGDIIYSYGYHFPMYVKHKNTWYENSDKYSVSTSKQQTQSRPSYKTKLKTTKQLKDIIYNKSLRKG